MHPGQYVADGRAVRDTRPARPDAFDEVDDRGRPASERAKTLAALRHDRLRTGNAASRQMRHQPKEERQVAKCDALLVQGQKERALLRVHEKVRILDALGDALVGEQVADVVTLQERRELFSGDVGVDRHRMSRISVSAHPRGRGDPAFARLRNPLILDSRFRGNERRTTIPWCPYSAAVSCRKGRGRGKKMPSSDAADTVSTLSV